MKLTNINNETANVALSRCPDTLRMTFKNLRMKKCMNIVKTKGVETISKFGFVIAACCFMFTSTVIEAQIKSSEVKQESAFTVTGMVCDANSKKPLPAVQIQALNNPSSATTDENGRFVIKLYSHDDVLSVKAYDYAIREFPVRGNKSIVIDLFPESFSTAYNNQETLSGIVRNSLLIPSAKTVSDFSISQAISADEFIQSEMGGNIRSISRSGFAGMGSSMFIRGYNSLMANSQPLYVIDGVIMNNMYDVESIFQGHYSNPLMNIDFTDIETMSVIKDGTSIYGSKASNGVILIKTTRGKNQVTKINLNIMQGITTSPSSMPVMNADQHRIFASDLIGTAGYTTKQISKLKFLQSDRTLGTYNTYHNSTDWNDEVFQNGSTKSYTLNVNGGDEKALYFFSLGYTGNSGVVKSTDFARINARFNADINLLSNLKVGLNVSYTNIDKSLLDDGANFYTSPSYLSMIKSPFLSPNTFTFYGIKTLDYAESDELGIGNPVAIIDNSLNYTRQHYFDFGFAPVWDITKKLKLSTHINYNLNKYEENYYSPILGTVPQYIEGFGYSENMIKHQLVRNISLFNDTKLSYKTVINRRHHIDALLGWRYSNNYYEMDYIEGHNTGSDNNTILNSSFDFLKTNGVNNETKTISSYANLDYNYANRYFLNASVSMDASSRFGDDVEGALKMLNTNWALFPSISGGWLISSEPFMSNVESVNLLKLRAGYGITGNDGIEDYATKTYFSTMRYLGFANGIVLTNIANNKLKWETTGRLNAGLDLGMFNDRVNFNFDVYSSKTKDLLTWKSLGNLAGIDAYLSNGGELSNKGFEMSLNLRVLNTKNLQWEVGLSAGHYKNRIESLPEGDIKTKVYDGTVLSRVGQPAGVFFGYKTKGVFSDDELAGTANLSVLNLDGSYSSFAAGDVIFDDFKSDGVINEEDMQIIGDPNPDIYGSFTSKLSFRKFTLSALFNYSYGNEVYNYLRSKLEAGSDLSNQTTAMLSRWTYEGQITNQPKAVFGDPMGNARFSDRWIEDGSYLRLKTLSLSYSIPINTTFISGLDLWVAANNLYTYTKYLGADPEFSAKNSVLFQGIDAGLIPQTKSFFVGVKVNL